MAGWIIAAAGGGILGAVYGGADWWLVFPGVLLILAGIAYSYDQAKNRWGW